MTLRVGIVGCGLIAGGPVREGRPISGNHAAACRAVPGIELVAAADTDGGRLAAFGRHWEVERLFSDAAAMLESMKLDLVIVTTPPNAHEAVCLEAIRRGARGILCEKPFTGSAEAAARIVAAAKAAGCALVVNFTRRWDASHRELARRIVAGELGDIRQVLASYTGTLRGNGAHFVDTLMMLAPGPWDVAWASALPVGSSDGPIDAVLTRPDGARAYLGAVRDPGYFIFEIHLLGTKARARLMMQGNDLRIDVPRPHHDFPGYLYLVEDTALPKMTIASAFGHALAELAEAVEGRRPTDVSPDAHVASLGLVDAIVNNASNSERTR
jgi:predicted dehydrogenase